MSARIASYVVAGGRGENMTPLHLDILKHYYISGQPYEMIDTNETRKDYAWELCEKGYLFLTRDPKPDFKITECGRKIFEKCLDVLGNISPQQA